MTPVAPADAELPASIAGEDAELRAAIEGEEAELAQRSWWSRPRRLRRQLAGALVVVALVSVALVGGLNLVAARELLDQGTQDQLVGVGEARARSIELGLERVLGDVSALAADLAVVRALERFDDAFADLEDVSLEPSQQAELDELYEQQVVAPINEAGLGPVTIADVEPGDGAAEYLQYHYIVAPGIDLEARKAQVDPGDGSAYSQTHAELHPDLVSIADALGLGDLKLISDESGEVVYSTEKRIDFGTSLTDGPYADTGLADTVLDGLERVRVGDAIFSDLEIYLPAAGQPVFVVAAAVRQDTEVIGALAVVIPIDALNTITTADRQWEEVGLESGESYVVGSDLILRSESRAWIEDPAGYLERIDDHPELARLIETLDSPVGLQPVDTEPVRAVLDGATFEGTSRNYLGDRTFTYASEIDAAGLEWVMVADIPSSDARAPLFSYARRLGLVLLILLPIAAVVGLWLARRLTRPIPPVVAAAIAVAEGDRDPDIPELGRNEFGDLARRLRGLANELERQELALEEEYETKRELLLTVLPSRIVEPDGNVVGTGETAELATVVALSVEATARGIRDDEIDLPEFLGQVLAATERRATQHDLERIRAAADRHLFLSGVGEPGAAPGAALDFAVAIVPELHELADEAEIDIDVHIGLSTGVVATGMLEEGGLTFAAWGEPVRRALAIGAMSRADELLIDASTVEALGDDASTVVAATDVVALDGKPMELYTVAADDGAQ